MSATPVEPFDHNPIFRLSTVLGLFPFNSSRGHKAGRSLLIFSCAVSIAVTALGGLSFLDNLSQLLGQGYNKAIILAYLGGHMLIFPSSLLCTFLQRDAVQETIQSIKEIHATFERIKMSQISNWTQLLPLLDISAPILCTIFYYLTNNFIPGTAFGTFYGFALLGMSLVCGQYSFLVHNVGDIYCAGVDFLSDMKKSVVLKRHSSKISEVVNAANKLGTASGNLNDIYALQILIFMSICFCGLSIHLYYISIFVPLPIMYSYKLLLPQVYSVLYYFYVVWRVNSSSAATSDKSREFNTLLYQLMIDDKTNEILHNDKLRLHISMKREVVFSACGYFNLDYTLVHSMIASATTYLVILIQFGQPATLPEDPQPLELTNPNTTPFPSLLTTPT